MKGDLTRVPFLCYIGFYKYKNDSFLKENYFMVKVTHREKTEEELMKELHIPTRADLFKYAIRFLYKTRKSVTDVTL